MSNFLYNFEKYMDEWKELDDFRLNWWLKYPLYLPIGFFLEMHNLNKKSKLTEEYSKYLKGLEEGILLKVN
jgi:hypothetical protein